MINKYQGQIFESTPLLKSVIEQHKNETLKTFVQGISGKRVSDIEDSEDIKRAVIEYLEPLFSREFAVKAAEVADRQRCILTANHHEVEFCVQSVQGNMLYEYWLHKNGEREGIIPIFSNTTVNMSNTNFPRGMIIYNKVNGGMPLKIPIFPFKYRNSMIAAADSFDEKMVKTAIGTVEKEMRAGRLSGKTGDVACEILREVYLADSVLEQEKYSLQIVKANRILSERYMEDGKSRYVYIELEAIASKLIEKDLNRDDSMLSFILWNEDVRLMLFKKLDGKTGCWDEAGHGTFLFWGVDERRRRFSLKLSNVSGKWMWTGQDMNGGKHQFPFTKEGILENMSNGNIVPCLFLTFFEIGFVRDYTLIGGCFQKTYLNDMLCGLIRTLQYSKGWEREIEILQKKESYYLSGPMFLVRGKTDGTYPAGSVELWEKPLKRQEFLQLMETDMSRAHEIGMFNFYIDLIPKKQQSEDEWRQIAKAIGKGNGSVK